MELMMITPQNSIDSFDFHSARTSPHASPPMTPTRFGHSYFSAPTSPSRVADFLEFDFQFCGDLGLGGTLLSSADDLFDGGKIRPLKSLILQRSEIMTVGGLHQSSSDERRGRAVDSSMSPHSIGRAARSLSPLRLGAVFEKQDDKERPHGIAKASLTKSSSVFRKWNLKDFLLFRSASEGCASNKYPLKKFETLGKEQDDRKSTSFRSADGSFGSGVGMRKKSEMSAHEVHYTKNKAKSESLKKKTYLPYKQGIFARLF